jgi:hypothetical protein
LHLRNNLDDASYINHDAQSSGTSIGNQEHINHDAQSNGTSIGIKHNP